MSVEQLPEASKFGYQNLSGGQEELRNNLPQPCKPLPPQSRRGNTEGEKAFCSALEAGHTLNHPPSVVKKNINISIQDKWLGQESTELRIQNSEQNSQINMRILRRLINCILWFVS